VTIEGTYLLGVRITDPAPSAPLGSDRATVRGTWVGYTDDVGVVVNGVPAAISGSTFVAVDVPLVPGSNALTATVTTFDGVRNTDAVTVSATGAKPALSLWANYASGVPPLTVAFRPEVEGIEPVEYRYDFDGDGVLDNTVPAGDVLSFTYATPGTFHARVTAMNAAGLEYTAEKTLVVSDRGTVDARLAGRWNALSTSLQAGDVEGSMSFLLPESQEKYRSIFTPLSAQLPTVFASVSPPELIRAEGNMAQYRVKREQLWDGVVRTITYYVWFSRDENGVWRIDRF
jgi:PKD repeat protein